MDLDKLNIQGMLDKFKQSRSDSEKTFRNIFAPEEPETEQEESGPIAEEPPEDEPAPNARTERSVDICGVEELAALEKKLEELDARIDEVSEALGEFRIDAGEETARVIRISENISGKVSRAVERLNDLNSSLSGVSKLNDSIFDLRNAQMNTKNSLGELEGAFFRMKKKMTTGVMLISILTAVTAVLEIINLLS